MVQNGHSVIIFPNWILSKQCMVRNIYGAKYIWYEMVSGYGTKSQFCGTKWLWCKIHMVRNGFFVSPVVDTWMFKN
jgi:hypothetical protein